MAPYVCRSSHFFTQGGVLPLEILPTPEKAVLLSIALEQNYTYFELLEKAAQMLLAYLRQERRILQEWAIAQAM